MDSPVRNHQNPIETDALVIGAGPVGLFQVFELGLLEIKAHVVDSLEHPGGQCVELYPDKPIYDIPAVPVCTGRELTENLLKQIAPFGATFHYGQEVTTVEKQDDGRFFVATSKGTSFLSKTIFIAAGVGAFQPRTLKVDGLDVFEDSQLFYRVRNPADFAGKNLVIVGGGDSALDWALDFVKAGPHKAASVILIHRRDGFKAAPSNVAKMRELCDALEMQFIVGQVTGFEAQDSLLTGIKVNGSDGITRVVPLDVLLVFFGLSPKLGPIADWGLDIERKQLKVDTEKFSTSEPGIFAVGDINTYPGKKKLILSGFHECALAAFGAITIISPEKKVFLQYTTTSPKLHKVLGVESPVFD
ncbi:MAG: NAD(P)/FAD-dependent oxidoreductase [Gammaproteobacteria bacterium]|nr:NAD(P)/FAD-dependent oxidoreductase [Rhodoferax sp.]MBU3900946.1 NAD(P)/FAD-dependent oxidoreductase [Gammaproteobacteria bacterium]MBU3996825.1 NAD(P)/FAD-dependent oxidoreductase [Gammaproteobacteria bacterium]MBU4017620.1 NAD(P)/FAD-dependent oxidoreductase [Gammaproteobacteria bacterium]MBU4081063.1 NAD(P)/FAD-dependent oxidoreductase [Gammaproteobacteria bacterium]